MADAPEIVAGCRMPSDSGIAKSESWAYQQARLGSEALRDRILAYAAKHHPDSDAGRRGRA